MSELVEVKSGKRNNRHRLHEAIAPAKAINAALIIAKMNRLSRNVLFLLSLKEAGVKFVAAENPSANNLTIGILTLIAEHDREAKSYMIKRVLAAAKAIGTKLGGYRGHNGSATDLEKAREARTTKANNKARLPSCYSTGSILMAQCRSRQWLKSYMTKVYLPPMEKVSGNTYRSLSCTND